MIQKQAQQAAKACQRAICNDEDAIRSNDHLTENERHQLRSASLQVRPTPNGGVNSQSCGRKLQK